MCLVNHPPLIRSEKQASLAWETCARTVARQRLGSTEEHTNYAHRTPTSDG